ncbi:MAG: response regulator [SAR324 cluster bacterium]|nr:response regulator [SAR324 cluster bacterium]
MDTKKIVIVEDDPMIMLSLQFLMKQQGHQSHLAKSGEEALELIKAIHPDLILMDVMLPNRTGVEICAILRDKAEFQHTKIILLTAKDRDTDIQKGMDAGANAYVTKPFSTIELTNTVQKLLAENKIKP